MLKAGRILEERYDVAADVWSITSYKALHNEAVDVERWNIMHPEETPRVPYVTSCVADVPGPYVAASDYVKALPDTVSAWFPGHLITLGADGFGRSDSRAALRDFFEVDARYIALSALYGLMRDGKLTAATLKQAMADLEIDADKPNPLML